MELIDIYDEKGNHIGTEDRKIVHQKALWHKTVHCWLYDKLGNIYFQIRKDEKTFYTTASGHVSAGESLKEAFGREIKEEIGIDIDYEKAELIEVVNFKLDKEKKDGSMFRDRAFSNVFGYEINEPVKFSLDPNEVIGIVKVNANEALDLFKKEKGKINAEIINLDNTITKRLIDFNEFLVNKKETAIEKYGKVLEFVINKNLEYLKDFIKEKHAGQTRKQGTPYYEHPISVAELLKEKGFGYDYYVTALFHDLLEDTDATEKEIEKISNSKILKAVNLLTKEKGYVMKNYISNINKNELARMVKLSDRLHNLKEGIYASKIWRLKYIKETKKYFIPLAKNTPFEEDINIALKELIKSL